MWVLIVERNKEFVEPLVEQLTTAGFQVKIVENASVVVSFIKETSLQFLIADETILVDRSLGAEVLGRCPLARLIALSSKPQGLKMVGALAGVLTDYFPLCPEVFPEMVKVMLYERKRIERWQQNFLGGMSLNDTLTEDDSSPANLATCQ